MRFQLLSSKNIFQKYICILKSCSLTPKVKKKNGTKPQTQLTHEFEYIE